MSDRENLTSFASQDLVRRGNRVTHAQLELTGSFEYQACEGEFCFLPAKIPLKWVFEIGAHDRVRVPESMQVKR